MKMFVPLRIHSVYSRGQGSVTLEEASALPIARAEPGRPLPLGADSGRDRKLLDRAGRPDDLTVIGVRPAVVRVVPRVVDLQEDPLRPVVVLGIAGRHLAVPVV